LLIIGLMSGTSLDGVDGVIADFCTPAPRILSHAHHAYDASLRLELLRLNRAGHDEIHRGALAANAVARAYAAVTESLLAAAGIDRRHVRALGAHGQTVRHRPLEFDGTGYTVQLLNGALLAELSGIDVVCDLRSRDLAAAGQGAPLVPAFHASVFFRPGHHTAVLNLGGIANLTLLGPTPGQVSGFDCGPGNVLLDGWCERHTAQPYDRDGQWAAEGRVDDLLLDALLAEPFLQRAPPKSTGRDLFSLEWLDERLLDRRTATGGPSTRDVQATLAEYTARAVASAIERHAPLTDALHVCGGGALNRDLMRRLSRLQPKAEVGTTQQSHGVPVDQVEALAFAWLAHAHLKRQPGNVPAVTGACGPRILGCLHPSGWG
jgi:anhydro-N-acetylmuramic acid kinase